MIVAASVFSAMATLLLCVFAMPLGQRLGLLDIPGDRKKHSLPTPLIGGLALLLALLPAVVGFVVFSAPPEWKTHLAIWCAAVALMSAIGLADDRHSLSARNRLLLSFAVFGAAAAIDPLFTVRVLSFEPGYFEIGLVTGWFAIVFMTICSVGLCNALNMADGKNGLVIGMSLGWLAMLAARAPTPLIVVIAALMAMLAVLLAFNLRGKVFLGDGGSYGVATAIGLVAIGTYNSPGFHYGRAMAAEEIMLLFAVPVLDSFRLTYKRLKQGRSPMSADRDHLHHLLQDRFGWPKGLVIYLLIATAPGLFGLIV